MGLNTLAASKSHVVIIGAGIVGAHSAVQALDAGMQVTLVEPEAPGGRQAASYGNAGWLSSHSILPPASPGVWKKVPQWLADPLGPLAIRWQHLPRLLPWLTRYLSYASTHEKLARTAHSLRTLLAGAPALHAVMAQRAGVPHLVEQRGLLHAFLSPEQFRAEAKAWQIRHDEGIRWEALDESALHRLEPDLNPRYRFGVLVTEAGSCRNPGDYTAALVRLAESLGARRVNARATGFRIERGCLRAVLTSAGEVACDKAVIATGVRAANLARAAGDRVMLAAERGYHAVLRHAMVGARTPTMFADCKVAVNWTDAGLRVAGQVELAGIDAAPNWQRARILRDHLRSIYPALGEASQQGEDDFWLGCRPSTPDGLPCIGPASGAADIIHAYGHGHVGLVSSARTGRLVAQLLAGARPEIDLAPFSPQRFQ